MASSSSSSANRWNEPPDCLDQILGFKTASRKASGTESRLQIVSSVCGDTCTELVVQPDTVNSQSSR